MIAGRLRNLITIQQATATRNSYGEEENTFASTYLIKANVKDGGTAEEKGVEKNRAVGTLDIETYYIADVTTADRVIHNGITYEILSITKEPEIKRMVMQVKAIE